MQVIVTMLFDVLASVDTMPSISVICGLAMWVYTICGVVSELIPSGSPVTSPSTLDLVVTRFPTNSSLLCPAACQCSVIQSSSGSRCRTAVACSGAMHDDDRFDPETEVVHVTGNCHRSFASVMASVGTLTAPRELSLRRCHLYTCLLYTSPSPRDGLLSRMPSSA